MTATSMIRVHILLALLATASARETVQLQAGWKFQNGDFTDAAGSGFDDSSWKSVEIPHDWAWEAGPRRDGAQEDKGGYRIGGIGWYRKIFKLPESFQDKRVVLRFDGAYRNATVFINGQDLGTRPYGYISFQHDISAHVKAGDNLLAVRIDNSLEPSTRWYHPCGIYAPVDIEATDRTASIIDDDVFVTTPRISDGKATVQVQTGISGGQGHTACISIVDSNGALVSSKEMPAVPQLECSLEVKPATLWTPENPVLYFARIALMKGDAEVDEQRIAFGVRSIRWDRATGFHLNGKVTKLRGVCEHLTGGPVGGAWPPELIEWKLKQLKSMGCNAIRTAHNPQTPQFLDACDRIGMMVVNEVFDGWRKKAPQDYGALHFKEWWKRDLESWIRRDRNHPSVILWSVGNETNGPLAGDLVRSCHELDPTRLVTSGASGSQAMDVLGINGHSESQHFFMEGPFDKSFVATEAPHTWQVRGFYKSKTWYRDGFSEKRQRAFAIPDLTDGEIFTQSLLPAAGMANNKQIFNSSYDNATVRINARQHWEKTRDLSWISGSFRWTGFDYPGEAAYVHGGWPFHTFSGGTHDLAGFEKDLKYFYQSQWTQEPMVHLLPHWTHPRMKPGERVPVHAYSNADEVELFLNGTSLGVDRPGRSWNEMQCEWRVPWQPGSLVAIARRSGKEVARHEHHSATSPVQLEGTIDSRFENHPIVTIVATDRSGKPYPYGQNSVHVHLEGDARILSFENGHPADTDSPVASQRRAFMGKARLFLKGRPESILLASVMGERRQLTSDQVNIHVVKLSSDGNRIAANPSIHYTTDGSAPDESSKLYAGPFTIPAVCTVRAMVVCEGVTMRIEETFGPDLGLHWSTNGEAQLSGNASALQAETAKFTGAVVSGAGEGFHGTGYLDFKGAEGDIQFYQENDGSAGPATLSIRYCHADPKRQRPINVFLNDKKVSTVRFPSTGSWTSGWKSIEVPVRIQPGANSITLRTTGQSAPNIDEVELQ